MQVPSFIEFRTFSYFRFNSLCSIKRRTYIHVLMTPHVQFGTLITNDWWVIMKKTAKLKLERFTIILITSYLNGIVEIIRKPDCWIFNHFKIVEIKDEIIFEKYFANKESFQKMKGSRIAPFKPQNFN